MTLVSQIITDAYRESNLVPLVSTPNTNQVNEALGRLNPLVLSTVGNEAGMDFTDVNVGGNFDQTFTVTDWIGDDLRLILNLTADTTLKLDPYPKDGQRIAVVDAAQNLVTNNLTLDANGRTIEGGASGTLNSNGLNRHWMYRADLGDWVRIAALTTTDQLPFPSEFDDYFVIMLAMRINPRYRQALAEETIQALKRSRAQLRARYNKPRQIRSDVNPRGMLSTRYEIYSDNAEFDNGRPWSLYW